MSALQPFGPDAAAIATPLGFAQEVGDIEALIDQAIAREARRLRRRSNRAFLLHGAASLAAVAGFFGFIVALLEGWAP